MMECGYSDIGMPGDGHGCLHPDKIDGKCTRQCLTSDLCPMEGIEGFNEEEITHIKCWSCSGTGKQICGCECWNCKGSGAIQIGGFEIEQRWKNK